MTELGPEERARIYAEEKARLEAREQAKTELAEKKKAPTWKALIALGVTALIGSPFAPILGMFGSSSSGPGVTIAELPGWNHLELTVFFAGGGMVCVVVGLILRKLARTT
ncbi:MAG: hypothetical protein HYY06_02475 [Deltaproteobacteria bacterium]|nr:hypothetical protein [Deltaproteobacteria bacterium]